MVDANELGDSTFFMSSANFKINSFASSHYASQAFKNLISYKTLKLFHCLTFFSGHRRTNFVHGGHLIFLCLSLG